MTELEALNKQKEENKLLMQYRDMVARLYENPDFKSLVLDYWCNTECARYAQVSGDPNILEQNRKDALAMAQAAGHFKRFLNVVTLMGNRAEAEMEELEQAVIDASVEE